MQHGARTLHAASFLLASALSGAGCAYGADEPLGDGGPVAVGGEDAELVDAGEPLAPDSAAPSHDTPDTGTDPSTAIDSSIAPDSMTGTGGITDSSTVDTAKGGGGGTAPASCSEANGSVGCCVGNVLYYCGSSSSSVKTKTCSGSEACGWNSSDSYYGCVSSPGGADPSGQNPIACQ
jgi:hypothetical protein